MNFLRGDRFLSHTVLHEGKMRQVRMMREGKGKRGKKVVKNGVRASCQSGINEKDREEVSGLLIGRSNHLRREEEQGSLTQLSQQKGRKPHRTQVVFFHISITQIPSKYHRSPNTFQKEMTMMEREG